MTRANPMNPVRPMKNIYNLITDAFLRIDKKESDYTVQVHKFQHSYQITITKRSMEMAFLNIIIGSRNNLIEFHDINTLFTEVDWERFCQTLELQGLGF